MSMPEHRLMLIPITLREANAFVAQHHRHHGPSRGCRFVLGAAVSDHIVGVAIAGRPVSRLLDDSWTVEVTRLCTDGTRHACSFLYGAARRVAAALGYRRIVTYTLQDESGASLRGAGWRITGTVDGRSWSTPSRPRVDVNPQQDKFRWEALIDA
jgi:hypothetical protein